MEAPRTPGPGPRFKATVPATIAAALSFCYALVLIGVVIFLLVAVFAHQGTLGHLTGYARRGPLLLSVLLLFGAAALITGAFMVRRGRRGSLILAPLGLLIVAGSIGEVADIINGSTLTGNLIGGGILLLAIIPVGLLLLPRERV